MKRETKLKVKLIFFLLLLMFIICEFIMSLYLFFTENNFFTKLLMLILFVSYLIIAIILFSFIWENLFFLSKKMRRFCKPLTKKEIEIVEDAINLIKEVDENIHIAKFNVYSVKFVKNAWFKYDEDTQERNIFIPFKTYFKWGRDICFLAVLHEILHSQNLKNNLIIFDIKFLEGLNQLLTVWLVENYSEKYKIPEKLKIASIKIKNIGEIKILSRYDIYKNEVCIVKKVFEDVDLKYVFLKYIDFKPEYFINLVPLKYMAKH